MSNKSRSKNKNNRNSSSSRSSGSSNYQNSRSRSGSKSGSRNGSRNGSKSGSRNKQNKIVPIKSEKFKKLWRVRNLWEFKQPQSNRKFLWFTDDAFSISVVDIFRLEVFTKLCEEKGIGNDWNIFGRKFLKQKCVKISMLSKTPDLTEDILLEKFQEYIEYLKTNDMYESMRIDLEPVDFNAFFQNDDLLVVDEYVPHQTLNLILLSDTGLNYRYLENLIQNIDAGYRRGFAQYEYENMEETNIPIAEWLSVKENMKKFCKEYGIRGTIHGWYWQPTSEGIDIPEVLLINPLSILKHKSTSISKEVISNNT